MAIENETRTFVGNFIKEEIDMLDSGKNQIEIVKNKINDILKFITEENENYMDEKLLDKIVVRCACDC